MKDSEILSETGNKIAELVENVQNKCPNHNTIFTIGVACTDINSLRKILANYLKSRNNKIFSFSRMRNYYYEEFGNIKITFSSIENHQEHEYDIIVLGILNFASKIFQKRIYTALTRAHNYAIIFGPKVKGYNNRSQNYLEKNKRILQLLQEGEEH